MFTPADISQLVGSDAMSRGEAYFQTGHVIAVARSGAGDTIVGQVRGSGNKQYVTVVELSSAGEQATPRYGKCSCPVRLNCKHTAAVLLAFLDKQNPTEPPPVTQSAAFSGAHPRKTAEWERTFAELLAPTGSSEPSAASARRLKPWDRSAAAEIGLQFELIVDAPSKPLRYGASSRAVSPEPRLGMRPVFRRDGGRWTRTGISWSELRLIDARDGGYPEGHVDVLRSLFGLSKSISDIGYFAAPAWLYADALPSSGLWAMLDAARRAGLPLLQSDKAQSPLVFSSRPATTELTVTRTAKGLALSAEVVVHDPPSPQGLDLVEPVAPVAGEPAPDTDPLPDAVPLPDSAPVQISRAPRNVTLLGSPPAGLFTWPAHGALGKESRILLARFESPLDATTVALVRRLDPLTVPRSDERRFLTRVFPTLQDRFDAVSLDPEITLPERPRPSLWLDVTHRPDHGADLAWQWRYATQDDDGAPLTVTVPFGTVPDPVLRDLAAETAILDRLAGRAPRVPTPDPQADLHGARVGVGQVELRGMDTALFFTEELPALYLLADAEADFGVELHSGAVGVDYRLTDDVDVTVTTSQLPDQRDWFDLGVIIRAGQQFVPFADVFKALAEGKSHILLVDGLHFTLDDDRFLALRDLIAEARALQDTMGGPLRINRFQAGLFEELERYGLVGAQAESWRASLGALAGGAKPDHVEPPAGLVAHMRSYQQEGFEWLAFLRQHGLGGVLADDMGLGKTIQALALIQHDRNVRAASDGAAPRRPFLVVAPTSVVGNWAAEARHFTPGLQTITIHETRARRRAPLAEVVAGADIVVTSYALFRLDFEEYDALAWDGLILDEAQFIKNHQSVAYQCARRLAVPFKLALTGTPLENNLMELWSILSVVSPGLFPSPARFKEYYARPIENDHAEERLDKLRRRVAPFMLRRTKEVVAKDLPAKQEQVVDVVLNSRHRKLYDKYLQRERTKVLGLVEEFGEHRFEVFRSLTVLRQASLDVSLVDPEHENVPSSKLEVLYEMLEDILAEGHSVLIFSQFTQFLGRVRKHLDKLAVDYSYLDGSTRRRTETIERFSSGETKVFLISLKAGGFGLNLTAADYCILLDPWWNPAAEAQAVDRAHRIGQKRNVMVYRMVSTDTIEEKVMALKASKSKLFASVLDGGAAGGAGLTATDVRELLT
ncbi:DEAD/DEAH box helicase [Sanguibacter gelidistatuariae]|uniref:DEAD/DEAH box helicase n=1 Tax=Sanguibacter gelidistatuariae TaxID=1814289 RepID=UPI0011137C97|nr:DEAD/DEAH box helicase [Sanguibacter gelidistatuariae]